MKITYIDRSDIIFEYTSYDDNLFQSVNRIFLSFPIKIDLKHGVYYCIDGHKRLSILSDIQSTKKVPCIVQGDLRSDSLWAPMNTH